MIRCKACLSSFTTSSTHRCLSLTFLTDMYHFYIWAHIPWSTSDDIMSPTMCHVFALKNGRPYSSKNSKNSCEKCITRAHAQRRDIVTSKDINKIQDLTYFSTSREVSKFWSHFVNESNTHTLLCPALVELSKNLQNTCSSMPPVHIFKDVAIPQSGKPCSPACTLACVSLLSTSMQCNRHHLPSIVVPTGLEWVERLVSILLLGLVQQMFPSESWARTTRIFSSEYVPKRKVFTNADSPYTFTGVQTSTACTCTIVPPVVSTLCCLWEGL